MQLLHIFKSGVHTDTSGKKHIFSQQDVEKIVRAYDPGRHEAPIVAGHPALDAPAYGWIEKLHASGRNLLAQPHQVDVQFAELVRDHRYKKISAAFYSPGCTGNPVPEQYYLRHVGFLGAHPPAVKGLKDAAFSEEPGDGVITIEFAEPADEPPKADDGSVQTTTPVTEEKPVDKETEEALAAENAALKKQLDEIKTAAAAAARDASHQKNVAFAESLIADARLAPAGKSLIVAVLDALGGSEEGQAVQFAEADGTRKPLAQAMQDLLTSAAPVISFAETATKDNADVPGTSTSAEFAEADPDRLSLHTRAQALAKPENITYEAAVKRLIQEDRNNAISTFK